MTFFWYDYETWGKSPQHDRIVQFGGVRTSEDLEQLREPIELKCQPGLDCPVGPGAVNVHGIMPMEAHKYGVSEAEFARRIHSELSKEGTCSVAYNGMSFDHEFTRALFYRNLRDPYEWEWKNGNTRWDTIELMRAAFLLWPDALKNWPKKEDVRPSFKLGDLSAANLMPEEREMSHDAMTDSIHMWKMAKLVRERARGFWDYALQLRNKGNIQSLMNRGEPVLYVIGKIPTKRHCSTFLSNLRVRGRNENEDFAFDLFYDPTPLLKSYQQWTLEDKSAAWRSILSFKRNQSPFVCKWSYVNRLTKLSLRDILDRMQLKEAEVQDRHDRIQEFLAQESGNPFSEYILQREAESKHRYSFRQTDPDEAIYEGFISDLDRNLMNQVLQEGANFDWRNVQSNDHRVESLIFRYLARNYPEIRDGSGKGRWEAYCRKRQVQDLQQRKVTADQIFSYELRDSTEPWGGLDESKANQLLRWQERVRERLMHPRQKSERLLQRSLNNPNARFRKGQWKAIDALVNDRSRLLLVQRSGWGKTMVYFLASRVLRDWGYGPTLIISPLLALIRNQEIAAERIKLRAKSVTGNNREQLDDIKEELRNDKVDLLLVTPERLSDKPFYDNVLQAVNFGLVVVDEAHCISDWGHDFRPDYRRIIGLLEKLPPNLPILGTTATANDEVVQDIEKQLSGIQVQRGPLTRENLELQTIVLSSPAKRMAWLAEQIPNLEGSGIVYVLKKRDAKNVAAWLRSVGVNAQAYFGGMKDHNFDNSGEYCRHIENLFLNNKITVLVATTALGMGYDKPDVGFVIHYQAPNSVVAYYQQVGRACRGEHSKGAGVLLSGKDDYEINKHFWGNSIPSKDIVERVIDFVGDPDGVTVSDIARGLNQGEKLIQQAIKYLSAQAPSPIEEIEQYRWRRTDVDFTMDWKAIRRVNAQREGEWKQIQEYIRSKDCRMAFLRRALSDFDNRECNRCDNCTGKSPVNSEFSEELEHQASEFLKESEFEFQCPVEIPPKAVLPCYGFKDSIPDDRRPSEVRVLSHYGDAGWGGLVKRGKYEDGYFDNELVEAIAEMITDRWKPKPDPKWVTCIPSARESKLVRSFSERLAIKLRLPFIDVLVATGKSKLQKDQKHPSNKCSNLDDAFKIKNEEILPDPVLLIDDIVESGWTFTIATALLRQEGSGDVFPVALASAAKS